jgi:hypothetical protein
MMRSAAFFIMAITLARPGYADTVHRVHFKAAPIILVWGEAAVETPSPVLTGRLESALATSGAKTFSVATNTPFEICLSSVDGRSLAESDLDSITIAMTSAAPNAQDSGAPVRAPRAGALCLWKSPSRTAARPGTPLSQALTFTAKGEADMLDGLTIIVRPLGQG